MDEQLIRQQTATILDAYRELTGSTEIPGIGDFLKLRECAIRERGTLVAEGTSITSTTRSIKQGNSISPVTNKQSASVLAKKTEKESQPVSRTTLSEQPKAKAVTSIPKNEKHIERKSSANSAFAMLRSIQDPWNS